ncbi:diheme cytochrome SoxA (sulfur oxidation) [Cereibacter ovatus]|uniref:SoxAX cytochrome complex subunit A n=1 Tax=Cereibacter ovatus TaxID=439529 RepID=A0A285CU18_9RHOB|nr:sulfur oxidation c-type cytochrome SoxA [Cereibacter ovatus]SNX71070.1 diheme cytochrome SoxA (sulfur oxidation) [Cereibacter ovatus]
MRLLSGGVTLAAVLLAGAASADPDPTATLIVNDQIEIATRAPAPDHLKDVFDTVQSGWLYRTEETRALQMDDFDNPAMVFVDLGLEQWDGVDGSEGKSCASCHQGIDSMKGVRASMPKVNPAGNDLWSLENFINACRTQRMGAEEWKWNSDPMKQMTAAISLQSRGMASTIRIDGAAEPYWEQGREIYYTRYGQLELSCANCHEQNAGKMIRADHLSQGQINGFPTYRLKDSGIVSIHGRFVGCIRDTRGEPFKPGSPEFRALELYVASRGMTLPIEGLSVRH